MKELSNIRDLNHQLEIIKIRREVELDRLKVGIRKAKGSMVPPLLLLSFSTLTALFKKRKKKK